MNSYESESTYAYSWTSDRDTFMNSHEKSNIITAFPEPVFMAPNFDYKY